MDDVRMGDPAGDADTGPSIEPAPGGLNLDTRSVQTFLTATRYLLITTL